MNVDHRFSDSEFCRSPRQFVTLRVLAALLLGLACLSSPACSPQDPVPRQPHPIIIVDVDTLRADHLGCYGYHRDTSPNIDAFSAESVFFEKAFGQAPSTPPSQTSILTGLYPSSHGMIYDDDRVPLAITTLAEALLAHGYKTAGFHDGGFMRNVFQIGQGFELYDDSDGKGLKRVGPKALEWMRQHAGENFLLFIHTYDPHTPYAPPPPYDTWFMEGVPAPSPGFEPTSKALEKIRLSKYTKNPVSLPPNDIAYAKALYDGEIRYVDTWFGEFWEVVRELGLDQRATIVFISDHGEEFQEHGSVLHEKLYTTITRLPLMIRLPGGANARSVPDVVESVDLMPTLLELAGVHIPEEVQGTSLVSLITTGRGSVEPPTAFAEWPYYGHRRGVVLGNHHMLFTMRDVEFELYDLDTDPLEQDNIAPRNPATLAVMWSHLEAWQAAVDNQPPPREAESTPLDEETIDSLKALGYVQ